MKFVLSELEVADALSLSPAEFAARRHELESLGFPSPVAGLGERWSIIDVINWVNRKPEIQAGVCDPVRSALPH